MAQARPAMLMHGKQMRSHLLAVSSLLFALTLYGQTFKSSVRLVLVDTQVLDTETGQEIRGLKREDFIVTDEGTPQMLSLFEYKTIPLNVVLLIDISGGLSRATPIDLYEGVHRLQNELEPEDELAVLAFAKESAQKTDFTNDPVTIKEAVNGALIDRAKASHDAHIYEAVLKATGKLARNPEIDKPRRNCVIAVTHNRQKFDQAKSALVTKALLERNASLVGLVLQQITGKGGKSFSIGFPSIGPVMKRQTAPKLQSLLNEHTIDQAALESGGSVLHYDQRRERIWQEALASLKQRYLLGFQAREHKDKNKFHRLSVALSPAAAKQHRRVSIRTKSGYYTQ